MFANKIKGEYKYDNSNLDLAVTDLSNISEWSLPDRQHVCLTVYVDSDKMSIALCPLNKPNMIMCSALISIDKSCDVFHELNNIKNIFVENDCQVLFSVLSVAGPISHDHVIVTNWSYGITERVILFNDLPFEVFPLDRRFFVNDIAAASYGIIATFGNRNLAESFAPLWKSNREEQLSLDGTSLILSVGPGNGVAFIIDDEDQHTRVISTELSHSQVQTQNMANEEKEFVEFVSKKIYSSAYVPEWEDLTCYRGLELAYAYLQPSLKDLMSSEVDDTSDDVYAKFPKFTQIRDMAEKEDQGALEAFRLFYRMIMCSMQHLALAIACQRVFLISIAQVQNTPMVIPLRDELKRQFSDHPRSKWFDNIPVYVQSQVNSFPLHGGLFLANAYGADCLIEEEDDDDEMY